MRRVWKVIQDSGNSQRPNRIRHCRVGVWPDGNLLWLEDGVQLQMVAVLNGAELWLAGGRCYEVFKWCLIHMLEASLASKH